MCQTTREVQFLPVGPFVGPLEGSASEGVGLFFCPNILSQLLRYFSLSPGLRLSPLPATEQRGPNKSVKVRLAKLVDVQDLLGGEQVWLVDEDDVSARTA